MTYAEHNLHTFIDESWNIEGLSISDDDEEFIAELHRDLLSHRILERDHLVLLADQFTDCVGELRSLPGLDVCVGNYIPERGGPNITRRLDALCGSADLIHPYKLHCEFEMLHPFTDGNGRVGRAIWLWRMERIGLDWSLGFLHTWYYQSMANLLT